MCGIAGWLGAMDADVMRQSVMRIITEQSHRGPDASGLFHQQGVTLGHVRLSIIDVQEQSNQPFVSTDGRYVIVFNGEIYNHAEIRAQLISQGSQFRTKSDTEVLVEAYKVIGPRCLDMFEGMFAFAIYDKDTGGLFCARDRLGEKPFYYSWSVNFGFVFASEMAALSTICKTHNKIDQSELKNFLSVAYNKSPNTLLSNISQLQPGYFLELLPNSPPRLSSYWSLVGMAKSAVHEKQSTVEELVDSFDYAVKACTTADVPYGVFLSGGIDSTSVVDSVARQGLAGSDFSTYTLEYSDDSFSELETARLTASKLNIDSRAVSYEDYEAELPDIIRLAAEVPTADPSFIPLYIVARAAKSEFKVMLGGDGGDELLLGYETYRATMLSQWLTHFNVESLHQVIRQLFNPAQLFSRNVSISEKLWRFSAYHVPKNPLKSHIAWRTIFDSAEIEALSVEKGVPVESLWFQNDWLDHPDWINDESMPLLTRASLIDYQSWLSDGVLRKLDSALMFNSVEGRTPFVNHHLINIGFRLPISEKYSLAKSKLPLRKRLQASGLDHVCKKSKTGFGFPLDRLFRGTLRDFLFDELGQVSTATLFDSAAVAKYLDEHDKGVANHGRKLYCLLILALWHGRVNSH